jgi:hypothetical protein
MFFFFFFLVLERTERLVFPIPSFFSIIIVLAFLLPVELLFSFVVFFKCHFFLFLPHITTPSPRLTRLIIEIQYRKKQLYLTNFIESKTILLNNKLSTKTPDSNHLLYSVSKQIVIDMRWDNFPNSLWRMK